MATDGTVTDGPFLEAISGLTVVEVAFREEALRWAATLAVACRCARAVRQVGPDSELDEYAARRVGD